MGPQETALAAHTSTLDRLELLVDVTQQNIDQGEPNRPCDCPIALAIVDALIVLGRRAHPMSGVIVAREWVGVGCLDGTKWGGRPPQEVTDFLDLYDDGGPAAVSPITFRLTLRGR